VQSTPSPQNPAAEVYFLTLVTPGRQPWLERPRTRDVFMSVLRAWHMGRDGRVLAAITMPEHAHVLLEPGRALTPLQLVAHWKSAMRRGAGYAETFEDTARGHKLRAGERPEDYALYMLLHPYRARLINPTEVWPGWWLPEPALFSFAASLDANGCPPPAWTEWPDERFAHLGHGE
jgi:REP element-mobilizing transposase RayT